MESCVMAAAVLTRFDATVFSGPFSPTSHSITDVHFYLLQASLKYLTGRRPAVFLETVNADLRIHPSNIKLREQIRHSNTYCVPGSSHRIAQTDLQTWIWSLLVLQMKASHSLPITSSRNRQCSTQNVRLFRCSLYITLHMPSGASSTSVTRKLDLPPGNSTTMISRGLLSKLYRQHFPGYETCTCFGTDSHPLING
ncbi:hypothetical protein C7974DRAFT_223938 [Boeremia exigua]|uniref:uncharacterized protein n=1 Tax=Boeremia exigua TaxID=749465 RepID=UPI001E8E59F1|nr:uncharacterized protein C7974DRAFT_223938 [Boeremia exigua]KAH6619966.1 hypothetical protein C7974DRAFT_223938 [Boeremia exigua]